MSQTNFAPPKDRSWVASALKELGRGAKSAASEPKPTESPDTRKQLIVLDQKANYSDSMKILRDSGLRPLTYQEALARSAELAEKLKGMWFWLAGDGKDIKEDKNHYTFDLQGNLKELTGNEILDQKVFVYKGDQPLSLLVRTKDSASFYEGRFGLDAHGGPQGVAFVVVGVQA